ncbi:MAG: prenyltransferase [Anaerolineae bacterium]|nr:prenyltransferase [Anaerolineae bacterium]
MVAKPLMQRVEGRFTLAELLQNWKEAILGCQCSGERIDIVSKWLVMTRACVFSMTFFAGMVGLLLAASVAALMPGFNLLNGILAVVGIVLAHAANNLLNDYFDLEVGLDSSDNYVRAQYAPHPILSGLSSRAEMRNAILLINVVDLAIMIYLTIQLGWAVIAFALAGLFISFFYTAPPIRLKRIGLGEIGVLLVWGPLMTGGVFYAAAGALPAWAALATIPYALIVTAVLMGKHVDKIPQDSVKGIRTLPVILGDRLSLRVNQVLITLFYPIVIGLVLSGTIGVWALLVLLSIPTYLRVMKGLSQPRPAEPPANYPVWPLWYVSIAFLMTRSAGATFALGLILNLIFPYTIKLF